MSAESTDKTAFSNEFGQLRFIRMPMGTRNSPSFFMKIMDVSELLKNKFHTSRVSWRAAHWRPGPA